MIEKYSMEIDINYNGIDVKANLDTQVNILTGFSGTGKTLFMKAMELQCLKSGISCIYCDSYAMNLTDEQLINICMNKDILLFDNTDLYMNDKILRSLKITAKLIIICMKHYSHLDVYDANEFISRYENRLVTLTKL